MPAKALCCGKNLMQSYLEEVVGVLFQSKAIALLFWICVADLAMTSIGISVGIFSGEHNPILAVFFSHFGIMGLVAAKLLFTVIPIFSLVFIYKKHSEYRTYINHGCFFASGIYIATLTIALYNQMTP